MSLKILVLAIALLILVSGCATSTETIEESEDSPKATWDTSESSYMDVVDEFRSFLPTNKELGSGWTRGNIRIIVGLDFLNTGPEGYNEEYKTHAVNEIYKFEERGSVEIGIVKLGPWATPPKYLLDEDAKLKILNSSEELDVSRYGHNCLGFKTGTILEDVTISCITDNFAVTFHSQRTTLAEEKGRYIADIVMAKIK